MTSHTCEIDFADQNLWAEAIYWPQNAYFFQTELHVEEGVSVKVSNELYTLDRWLSRLQMTMWSQIAPQPENIFPKEYVSQI